MILITIVIIIIIFCFIRNTYHNIKKDNLRIIDHRGYYRNGHGKLVHRDIAYKYIYSYPQYPKRFGEYDIHHIDGDKLNNNPDNLEILTREEHIERHGH